MLFLDSVSVMVQKPKEAKYMSIKTRFIKM